VTIPALLLLLTLPDLGLPRDGVPRRLRVAAHVAGAAWGHDPALLLGLAWVESEHEANPRRYGTGKRYGPPPLGKRWKICGLMQIHGGARPMGTREPVRFPPCEILVLLPEVSLWFGAMHLAGWKRALGTQLYVEGYNKGFNAIGSDMSFTAKVERAARRFR